MFLNTEIASPYLQPRLSSPAPSWSSPPGLPPALSPRYQRHPLPGCGLSHLQSQQSPGLPCPPQPSRCCSVSSTSTNLPTPPPVPASRNSSRVPSASSCQPSFPQPVSASSSRILSWSRVCLPRGEDSCHQARRRRSLLQGETLQTLGGAADQRCSDWALQS